MLSKTLDLVMDRVTLIFNAKVCHVLQVSVVVIQQHLQHQRQLQKQKPQQQRRQHRPRQRFKQQQHPPR